jgi:Spy/CpxP family protein refolding chaperone
MESEAFVLKSLIGILLCSLGVTSLAFAKEPEGSPYAGQELRSIKSLSEVEARDLLAGRGMGLAKSAELNRYPGPAHVLELADRLGLTADQKARTQMMFRTMEANARSLGKALLEQETTLDRLFASRRITREQLAAALEQIGRLQGQLRKVHLEAHLEQTALLTPEQIERYDELRGYGTGASVNHAPGSHEH